MTTTRGECLKELLECIEMVGPLPLGVYEALVNHVSCHTISKGQSIIEEGAVSTDLFFLNNGLLRHHYRGKDNEDITASFVQRFEFFTNVESFISNTGISTESISAIEDSKYCVIDREKYFEVMKAFPELYVASIAIINRHRVELDYRVRILQNLSSKERYALFLETYPKLSSTVQLSYIASFLGIRLETLSRIRNKKFTIRRNDFPAL